MLSNQQCIATELPTKADTAGSSSGGPKDLSVRIDGWSARQCGGLGNFRLLVDQDIPGGLWRKRSRVMQRYLQVGIVKDDGMLTWNRWDTVGDKLSLHLPEDFMRLLGKGSGYRFMFSQGKKKTILGLKSYKGYTSDDNGRTPHCLSEALQAMLTTQDEYFKSSNCVNFQRLKSFLKWLESSGFMLRKEDRGPRFVLCSVEWEKKVCSDFSRGYKKSTIALREENKADKEDLSALQRVARIYFIPKTQKPSNVPMKGRPIVSFLGCIDRSYVRCIVKTINKWVVDQKGFDRIRTDEAITVHAGRTVFLIGDLESMFTNVPRQSMDHWLDNSNIGTYKAKFRDGSTISGQDLIGEIRRIVSNLKFQYRGEAYEMTEGLPMGHPMSPPIARAVVTWMERNLVAKWVSRGWITTRYVDDVKVSLPHGAGEEDLDVVKEEYEAAILPMKIEWRDGDRRYMDSQTDEIGVTEFVKNKPTGYIPDELPEAIRAAVLAAEVRRRIARGDEWDLEEMGGYIDEFGEVQAIEKFSHVDEYLQFHGVDSSSMKEREAVTKPTPRKRTGELLHIPYTGFIRTRRGKMLKKFLEEKYTRPYMLYKGRSYSEHQWKVKVPGIKRKFGADYNIPVTVSEPAYVGLFWDITSRKGFTVLCRKSKHYTV